MKAEHVQKLKELRNKRRVFTGETSKDGVMTESFFNHLISVGIYPFKLTSKLHELYFYCYFIGEDGCYYGTRAKPERNINFKEVTATTDIKITDK